MPSVLACHPRAVFVFVGANGSGTATITKQLAAAVPSESYRIVNRQPQERIPHYLAMADVAVSPRIYGRNLPLKIFDYLAAGRVIVATSIPAHRRLLSDDLAIFTEPTPESIGRAIVQVLSDGAHAAKLQAAARAFAVEQLSWTVFVRSVAALYAASAARSRPAIPAKVSVVIPAFNAAAMIGEVVRRVRAQEPAGSQLEILVVDDGSTDDTAREAQDAGARVIASAAPGQGGNPAAARNLGARESSGDPIVFLDADCTPHEGWLAALLEAHAAGAVCVGGSLALPDGLSATARWDYYCGWYHAHPRRRRGGVGHHPPCNVSVRRDAFLATRGFDERQPVAYSHEELSWQSQLRAAGQGIVFEPRAAASHWNRPGLLQLLRRNYRWAYSALQSKAEHPVTRLAWLYRHPALLMILSVPSAPLQAAYITGCWLRAGRLEPLAVFPIVLLARVAYSVGFVAGGLKWLSGRRALRPQPVET
jgi:GT2 family glycosyltransferase